MMLYEKIKKNPDYCVRCYLTYKCNSMCEFCSAQIPQVDPGIKDTFIPADIWADGINSRSRHTILAGGEPFIYEGFVELISKIKCNYKVEIYTNLTIDVTDFIKAARGKSFYILASLHPGTDIKLWLDNVSALTIAGHKLRFHVVKSHGYEKLVDILNQNGITGRFSTAIQGDQRAGIKSSGLETNLKYPYVKCSHKIYIFGPDGNRYHCVHKMIMRDNMSIFGHISKPDEEINTVMDCNEFGYCAGCDNNIEGTVEKII